MAKTYTAQEMRFRANLESNVWGDITTAEMLRQAADLMEREEKREKKYEYAHKYGEDIIDSHHVEDAKDCFVPLGSVMVRRPIGEWEEVKE